VFLGFWTLVYKGWTKITITEEHSYYIPFFLTWFFYFYKLYQSALT